MKEALSQKKLIHLVKSEEKAEDGILLFGKYSGSKISELLGEFSSINYVTKYLAEDKSLPFSFKKSIREIIENYDPFSRPKEKGFSDGPLKVRLIDSAKIFSGDDIPF